MVNNMPMILYVCYTDLDNSQSGSSVRPQKMLHAFEELGYEILLLSGDQRRMNERRRSVQGIFTALGRYSPDFCYIELPSGPIQGFADRRLLMRLSRLGIPTAAFYRDAYYRLAPWWNLALYKKITVRFLHSVDIGILRRCCDIVYFPSRTMASLFDFPQKGVLPPACERLFLKPREDPRVCIYVGGLSRWYGTDLMLRAFEMLNRGGNYPLILVCRESETIEIEPRYRSASWLTISHASGKELEGFYARADIGLYCGRRDQYMNLSMPVKLFGYLSYGLPVVVTNCTEVASFVRKNGVGLVVTDDSHAIAAGVRDMVANPTAYRRYYDNLVQAIKSDHLWIHRAGKVAADLEHGTSLNSKL